MENQLWEKVQMLIDAGRVDMVVHLLVEEMEVHLTEKQIEQLGDLKTSLIGIFSGENRTTVSAKKFIAGFIDMINQGAIVGVDKGS